MLRYIIVIDAGKKTSYMSNYVVHQSKVIGFLVKIYPHNKHWVTHIIGAAFQIKKNHPDKYIAEYWGNIAHTSDSRIRNWKDKEYKRIKHEKYVKGIIDKYIDIYTKRYV